MIEIGTSCLSVHRDVDKTLSRLSEEQKEKGEENRRFANHISARRMYKDWREKEERERKRIKISLD